MLPTGSVCTQRKKNAHASKCGRHFQPSMDTQHRQAPPQDEAGEEKGDRDLRKMSMNELREALEAEALDTSGSRSDLARRLRKHSLAKKAEQNKMRPTT